jgi:putative nucleotidyltransferase with HDIG domain
VQLESIFRTVDGESMSEVPQKILIVDDEPSILKSLQRLLIDEPWDCQFVGSGKEALALLQQEPFDLIMADVQMPEMDGIQLMVEIRRRYPHLIRLFLTAFSTKESVAQAFCQGHVQQIIPKPWIDQELREIIRSALRQSRQQKNRSPEFQAVINSIPLLPALPKSYIQVRDCLSQIEFDIDKIATIINQDVALTSVLLHWANSALFGQRYLVDTVKKAIIVLGTIIVENLILSEAIHQSLVSDLQEIPEFSLCRFQKHSTAVATISRLLVKSLDSSNQNHHDRAFTAGLLHDLGKLAAASFFGEQFGEALRRARQEQRPLPETELEVIGITHAELGSFLAEWWALPPFIVNTIHNHHQPPDSGIDVNLIHSVYLANLLSYQFGYAMDEQQVRPAEPDSILERFYLTDEGIEILQEETHKIMSELSTGNGHG